MTDSERAVTAIIYAWRAHPDDFDPAIAARHVEPLIAAEREACAKVAEADHGGTAPDAWLSGYRSGREAAARDIRFRNQR